MTLLQETFDPEIAAEFGEQINNLDFLGVPLFDGPGLWNLLIRFAFNLAVCWVLIGCFYYKKSKRKDYYFTFMMFSVTIFLLLFLLQNLSIEIGFALGLFAIFGMIRYRTETVPIREMTYLFIIIGVSIINGFGMTTSYTALLATNLLIIATTWILESVRNHTRTTTKIIVYEKIELIQPERKEELIADLKNRTGLKITNVEIGSINFLKDTAYLKVTYEPGEGEDCNSGFGMRTKF